MALSGDECKMIRKKNSWSASYKLLTNLRDKINYLGKEPQNQQQEYNDWDKSKK